VLGVHSLVWDEAVKIAGQDPDFHRRSMWESIEAGNFFEWELGVQLLPEADEEKFDFYVLDATKIWPEDLIPVQRIGKLTLNRNPDNYFSETEQVAFMTTNIVPGIDFSNDPLLQGRNFSYLDTQLSRLGTPNFHELPINRPVCPFSNNQRDAHMRHTINKGRVSYTPASLDGHSPDEERPGGGFNSFGQVVNGPKLRERAESFNDHYGQARLFWNSQTPIEKEHIVKALQFELSKVDTRAVRVRMLDHLQQINDVLASQVALAIGEKLPSSAGKVKPGGTADKPAEKDLLAKAESPTTASGGITKTSGLSMEEGQPKLAKGRQIAILAAPGVSSACVLTMQKNLADQGVAAFVVAPFIGELDGDEGTIEANKTFANSSSVLFDAVYVPGGASVETLKQLPDARKFIDEAFKHGKAIAATGEGTQLVDATTTGSLVKDADAKAQGVLMDEAGNAQTVAADFIEAIAAHRFSNREVDLVAA
jgi:catalase